MLKAFKPHLWLSVVVLSISMLFLAGNGSAETSKPLKIGVVNRMQILEQSQEGQSARNQLEKEKNEKQRELDKIQDELKKIQDELEKQGALLTEEKKREKVEILERKGRDLKRLFDDYNRDLAKREEELFRNIISKINKAIKDYGQEQSFSVILDSTTIVYGGQEIDITADILKRLNLHK